MPRSRGGLSVTENCVPACLACNGHKSDTDAFDWYRQQRFYDPRRAMAIRAWVDGDLRLAVRLLQWANPESAPEAISRPGPTPRAVPGAGPKANAVARSASGTDPRESRPQAQRRTHGSRQQQPQHSSQSHAGLSNEAWETAWGWQTA